MVDPNKPIIETRSTLLGGQAQISPKQMPPVNGSQTAGAENKTAPIEPAGNTTSTTTRSATSGAISSTVPATYSASSYDELIPQIEERMSKYRPLSEEELKKLRRRHRAEGIISGVADAAQAVANLYYTHHYAPNMYNAADGLSAKARERFDKAKAEREAEGDKFFNYALAIGKLKDDAAKDDRNWNHTLEREKVQDARNEAADARAQAKADRDASMAQLKMMYMQGQLDAQELAAEIKEVEKQYANQYWNAKIGRLNYRPPVRSGGGGGRSGGSGKPGEYPWYDADGNKHYAHSYEAARQNSLDHGTWNEATQQSTSQKTQQKGRKTTTTNTTTTKPAKGHSTKPAPKKSAKSSFSIHK